MSMILYGTGNSYAKIKIFVDSEIRIGSYLYQFFKEYLLKNKSARILP